VTLRYNALQEAMELYLEVKTRSAINSKVKMDLQNDGLLSRSRLGILVDAIARHTTSSTYQVLVEWANDNRESGETEATAQPEVEATVTKKQRTLTTTRQQHEGIFSNVIAINNNIYATHKVNRAKSNN